MLGDISCISYSKNPRVNKDMMVMTHDSCCRLRGSFENPDLGGLFVDDKSYFTFLCFLFVSFLGKCTRNSEH